MQTHAQLETLRELADSARQRREMLLQALHIELALLPEGETEERAPLESALQAVGELLEASRVELLRLAAWSKFDNLRNFV